MYRVSFARFSVAARRGRVDRTFDPSPRELPPMVYVDDAIWNWQGLKWCHLLADDIDELHGFAARLGISRASYQGPPKTTAPHYDLTGFERVRALALGAKPCSRQEIVAVFRVLRVAGGKRTRR